MMPYLLYLLATIAIETAVAAVFLTGRGNRLRCASDVVAVNLISHPLAYASVAFGGVSFGLVELAVVLGECVGFQLLGSRWPRSVMLGVVCNLVTITVACFLASPQLEGMGLPGCNR